MTDTAESNFWYKFFCDAGIPKTQSTDYAAIFMENRIKQEMLLDLNKEYLRDMDIVIMGDIISILKQAKAASTKLSRQKTSQSTSQSSMTMKSDSMPEVPPTKKSTPATRMLEHYVRKEPLPPPPPPASPPASSTTVTLSPSLSARLGGGLKRPADDDEPVVGNKRSSVFNRLGDNSVSSTTSDAPQPPTKITVTMFGKKGSANRETSAFKVSPSVLSKPKSLQYQGVLKYSARELAAQEKEKEKEKLMKNVEKQMVSDNNVRRRLGLKCKQSSRSEGIFAQEIVAVTKPRVAPKPHNLSSSSSESSSESETDDEFGPPKRMMANTVITKTVKINKKTGLIVQEKKREIASNVFNRLK